MTDTARPFFRHLTVSRRIRLSVLFVICYALISPGNAQTPVVQGQFLTDSIDIGRPFRYALTFDHAPTVDVFFPDTARQFSPFLVQNVVTLPTRTTGSGRTAISRDSAVYTLVSFSVDSVQVLRVPVLQVNNTDSTTFLSQPDTVLLRSTLNPAAPGKPNVDLLTAQTDVLPLKQQFNYPLLGVSLLVAGIVGFLLYGLFRKPISRFSTLYQLNRRHIRFLREYTRLIRLLNADTASDYANQSIILWKAYLEKLEKRPYVPLTTSEIAERMGDPDVADALRQADRMIYGGDYSDQSQAALRMLSGVATRAYHQRRMMLDQ